MSTAASWSLIAAAAVAIWFVWLALDQLVTHIEWKRTQRLMAKGAQAPIPRNFDCYPTKRRGR